MERVGRGDGIGIELTRGVVRGVLLAADDPHRLHAATEVGIRHFDDDRSVLDALIRLRAELGPAARRRGWHCSRPAPRCIGST